MELNARPTTVCKRGSCQQSFLENADNMRFSTVFDRFLKVYMALKFACGQVSYASDAWQRRTCNLLDLTFTQQFGGHLSFYL